MGTSEYSKGKGSRRGPWRGGGRGKQKIQTWESRAAHAVDSPTLLGEKPVQLYYRGAWEKNASERIYLLDQEFSRAGIVYAAELDPGRWHPTFTIFVPASMRSKAAAIIAQLDRNDQTVTQPQHVKGISNSQHYESIHMITPDDLPAHLKDNAWEFVVYSEYDGPSRFSSKLIYRALVFRNKTNTVYGIKEWYDSGAPSVLNKMARRIVVDAAFRQSLITADPRAPEIWEKLGLLPEF